MLTLFQAWRFFNPYNSRTTINKNENMIQPTRSDLIKAVKLIKQWHDMPDPDPDPFAFKIYYNLAPEMKFIRDILGLYDEMKDEVIESTSVTVVAPQSTKPPQ